MQQNSTKQAMMLNESKNHNESFVAFSPCLLALRSSVYYCIQNADNHNIYMHLKCTIILFN